MRTIPKLRVTADNRLDLNKIVLTESLGKLFGLQNKDEIIVGAGKRKISLIVNLRPGSSAAVSMHPTVVRRLCLRPDSEYGYVRSGRELRLGPMVGIMIEILGSPSRPYAVQTTFIKQLITNGQEIGEICYAFSPYAIDWQRQLVTGYTYWKGVWIKQSFPFPDVIYPRSRVFDYSNLMTQIRKRFDSLGIKFLNPLMAGKWVTYQTLSSNPSLADYLPDTRLLTDFRVVEAMVKKYQTVYLKPVIGSKGKNIIRVTRNRQTQGYQYQYQKNRKTYRGTAANINQLKTALRIVMNKRNYLVQQGINLLTYQGHITDVRVIVQKNDMGQWAVTGIGCRMGPTGSITSNISSGGQGAKLAVVLERHFQNQEQRQQIERDVRFLALESARILEKTIGSAGEMGVDLGIDEKGKVWFIEANMRPARSIFLLIDEPQTRHLSVLNPMLYSRYLAGFTGKE